MTYKDVLDDLLDIFKRHKMIQTWGYGNLSDLVAPFVKSDKATEDAPHDIYTIDYPYAFLQPLGHSLQKGKSTFNFNLIMMEQCSEDPQQVIQAQSNCYQYIQDVLAEIYYNYDQQFDFTLNSSVNPFKEKYNDTVSGMTANISLEIPMVLDDCLAPFDPRLLVEYRWNLGYTTEPDPNGQVIGTNPLIIGAEYWRPQTPAGTLPWNRSGLYFDSFQPLVIEVEGIIEQLEAKPLAKPIEVTVYTVSSTGVIKDGANIEPSVYTGWPSGSTPGTFEYTARYDQPVPDVDYEEGDWQIITWRYVDLDPTIDESTIKIQDNRIKVYRKP